MTSDFPAVTKRPENAILFLYIYLREAIQIITKVDSFCHKSLHLHGDELIPRARRL